jgi:hypothetical protein
MRVDRISAAWLPRWTTPMNNRIKFGKGHAHPVMAGEGPPSTTFLRAPAKSWMPTGACHRALDPVVGMTGRTDPPRR